MKVFFLYFSLLLVINGAVAQSVNRFCDSKTLDEFLSYRPERKQPLILAHRGGPGPADTENSIPTFAKTASILPDAILEMDVRITRDSNYVLLHDPTLDRESTGTGLVSDRLMNELKQIKLKTLSGKLTDQRIPTFDEVLAWNQNRYVLALDIKPGTDLMRVMEVVQKKKAEHSVFVICYSLADAQRIRARFPTVWLAMGINGMTELERLESGTFPTTRLIALTPQKLQPVSFYDRLHKLGVLCSIGTYGPNQLDEKPLTDAAAGYRALFKQGGDILTTDRPKEVMTLF